VHAQKDLTYLADCLKVDKRRRIREKWQRKLSEEALVAMTCETESMGVKFYPPF